MDAVASLIYMHIMFEAYYSINPIPMAAPTFTNLDLHGSYCKATESVWNKVFPQQEKTPLEEALPEIDDTDLHGDW